jgi:hypothetical protein
MDGQQVFRHLSRQSISSSSALSRSLGETAFSKVGPAILPAAGPHATTLEVWAVGFVRSR